MDSERRQKHIFCQSGFVGSYLTCFLSCINRRPITLATLPYPMSSGKQATFVQLSACAQDPSYTRSFSSSCRNVGWFLANADLYAWTIHLLGRLFRYYPLTETSASVMRRIVESKHHRGLHLIVSSGFGLQESQPHWMYKLLLLIGVSYLHLLFRYSSDKYFFNPLLVHVVFYLDFTHTLKHSYVRTQITRPQTTVTLFIWVGLNIFPMARGTQTWNPVPFRLSCCSLTLS